MNSQNYYEEQQRKDIELLRDLEDEYRLVDNTLGKHKLEKQIKEIKQRIQKRDQDRDNSHECTPSTDQNLAPTEPQPLNCEQVAIRFDLLSWIEIFRKSMKDTSFLLEKDDFSDSEEVIFKDVNQFLLTSLRLGLNIEVYDSQEKISLKIQDNLDFWAILIASLSTSPKRIGYLKWLIKETFSVLKAQGLKETKSKKISDNLILDKIWQHIFEQYCNSFSRYHKPEILREITSAVIACAEEKNYSADFLYQTTIFLYNLMGKDIVSIGQIAGQLDEYDMKLENDAAPKYLQALKRLVGIGINTRIHGANRIPHFKTVLVKINNPYICDYEFESMAYSLTVLDYATIRGIAPRNLDANLKEPHVFKIVSDSEISLFNLLSAEILSIVRLCQDSEKDEDLVWDVPTIYEWLTLADCIDKPYPWGSEEPQRKHANIHFSNMPSRLHPVGTYMLGASKYGTYDCCGNVHEIVRISQNDNFPGDFRLMGGCYTTPVFLSSCQIIRHFKPRRGDDNRRNVGLRLIRYKRSDSQKRLLLLQDFPRDAVSAKNIWGLKSF